MALFLDLGGFLGGRLDLGLRVWTSQTEGDGIQIHQLSWKENILVQVQTNWLAKQTSTINIFPSSPTFILHTAHSPFPGAAPSFHPHLSCSPFLHDPLTKRRVGCWSPRSGQIKATRCSVMTPFAASGYRPAVPLPTTTPQRHRGRPKGHAPICPSSRPRPPGCAQTSRPRNRTPCEARRPAS